MRFSLLLVFAALSAPAQPSLGALTNRLETVSNSPAETFQQPTNRGVAPAQRAEEIRAAGIASRRSICGKILKIQTDGLVVDSGYTNLLRAPLTRSWLAPGKVSATRAAIAVEGHEPNALCIGQVFLTDLPKLRGGAKPKLYDYVMLEGYPAGEYTYTSVGSVQRTVRKFSASLDAAVRWKFKPGEK